ncbi:MAG: hypothetical protein ACHQIM_04155, partial [Sphingobacteriales bacterium]
LYWSPILAFKVKEIVFKSSDSLYTADFSSAEMHVLRGTIVIYNITLKPDTVVYNRRRKEHLAPNNLVELHVKRLTLSHIHPFKLYFQKKLDIGEIELNEPVLNITYQLNHTKDTSLKPGRTMWQKISKNLNSIHIGNILLGDIKLTYKDYSGNKLVLSELKELNISAHDLLIDPGTQTDKSRILFCKEIIAELNNYSGKTANGLYSYKINSLKLSTLTSKLNISGLSLQPVDTGLFFNKSQHDRFLMHIDSMQVNNFDYANYHKYRILNASDVLINNGTIEVFCNPKHLINDGTDQVSTFPNAAIYQINDNMKIDSIILNHINVVYSEYNKKSNKTGSVTFNNTEGRFLNVTNNKTALQKNNVCTAEFTSYFMNRGKLNVKFNFNLTDLNKAFSYKGRLGPLKLQYINPVVMPLAMVKVTTGNIDAFDFDIHADRTSARGRVSALYDNLKISILKVDTVFDGLKQKPIATLYANLFIVKHNNPDIPGGLPRSTYVNYSRTPETPFFKSVWQTLLSGIKPCIGLDKKAQDAAIAMQNELAANKQNRKIKKEQRLQRRAERRLKREEEKSVAPLVE